MTEDLSPRIENMDALDIDVQILSLSPTLWSFDATDTGLTAQAGVINDELIDVASRSPNRFRIFAHLPLGDPAAAAREVERVMASRFVVGFCIPCHVNGTYWDDPALIEVLAACERSGSLLFVHPDSTRIRPLAGRFHLGNLVGNPTETTLTIGALIFGGVLDRLPEIRLLFAHGGGYAALAAGRLDHGYRVRPELSGTTAIPSTYLRRLYFDSLLHGEAALRFLIDTVGGDRVVLGTDYPADMGQPDPIDTIRGYTSLTEGEKVGILGRNLAGLLGLEQRQGGPLSDESSSVSEMQT